MDIGTKKEPGRELDTNEVREVDGGYAMPDPTEPPAEDPFGPGTPPPVDYSTP